MNGPAKSQAHLISTKRKKNGKEKKQEKISLLEREIQVAKNIKKKNEMKFKAYIVCKFLPS